MGMEDAALKATTNSDHQSLDEPAAKPVLMTIDRTDTEDAAMKASPDDYQSLDMLVKLTNTNSRKFRACMCTLGVAFSEKLIYYSIFGNLVTYLSRVMHLDVASSAKNVNNAVGVSALAALGGAYIADAHLGRYWTIVSFFIVYCLGLASLAITTSLPSLRPTQCSLGNPDCRKATSEQIGLVLLSVYLIVVGTSGNPCYQAFGGDQFDDQGDVEERKKKASYFNWLFFAMYAGSLATFTFIVYIQENVGWDWAFAILAALMLMVLITFIANSSNYRKRPPSGSPLTLLAQVLVAAARNRKAKLPSDHQNLYELAAEIRDRRLNLLHTSEFRFLDKAAICLHTSETTSRQSAWRLCTVTQVEEVKMVVRVIPVWITCLTFGACTSQLWTFFIKQGSKMDTRLGAIHIPPASLRSFDVIAGILFMPMYDRFFVPFARRFTGNIRGITMLQRIGTGLVLATLSIVAAALVEKKRLSISRELNLLDNPWATTPMTCLWLIPQFVIMGIANNCSLAGIQEFFYDQLPDSMRSMGIALYVLVTGVGSFLSSLLINIVVSITGHGSHQNSWIVDNLNRARLDKYYWTLAIISTINFCIFVAVAVCYSYKQSPNGRSTQASSASASSSSSIVTGSHIPCESNNNID